PRPGPILTTSSGDSGSRSAEAVRQTEHAGCGKGRRTVHDLGAIRLDGWRTECWCGRVFGGELIWHCVLCGQHPPEQQLSCPGCGATRAVVSAGGRAMPAFALVQSGERLL